MLTHSLLLISLLLPLCLSDSPGNAIFSSPDPSSSSDRMYLPATPSLAFIRDSLTKTRRTDPRPQMDQVGGDARTPPRVDCYNIGAHKDHVKWHCVASGLQLKHANVKCEGYGYEGDDWVLKGSCWVEFEAWIMADKSVPEEQQETGGEEEEGESTEQGLSGMLLAMGSIVGLVAVGVFVFMKNRASPRSEVETPLLSGNSATDA